MKEEIEAVLYQAIELLNKNISSSEALSNMAITFILQLAATLVLFLIVRFKFWNLITGMIEARKTKIEESLKQKDTALLELENAKKEAEMVKVESKKTAAKIIDEAKKTSYIEAEEIINNANQQAEQTKLSAQAQIEKERKEMQEGIKNEIVEVAYLVAEKMVEHEIDKNANKELVEQAISSIKITE